MHRINTIEIINLDAIHGNFQINLLQMLIFLNYLNVINMEIMMLTIKLLILFYLKLLLIGIYINIELSYPFKDLIKDFRIMKLFLSGK